MGRCCQSLPSNGHRRLTMPTQRRLFTDNNNGSAAIDGWTLAWNFTGNQQITNMWNGTYTQSGTAVTVKNLSYNNMIPAKGSVSFGFNLSYSGTNTKPTGFTLNGTACQIQ